MPPPPGGPPPWRHEWGEGAAMFGWEQGDIRPLKSPAGLQCVASLVGGGEELGDVVREGGWGCRRDFGPLMPRPSCIHHDVSNREGADLNWSGH